MKDCVTLVMTLFIFTASASTLLDNSRYGKNINISSCLTGLDTGATCDLETFPTSQANLTRDVNYCCSLPLSFQEFGVCGETGETSRSRYNVPVCHSYTKALSGELKLLRNNDGLSLSVQETQTDTTR